MLMWIQRRNLTCSHRCRGILYLAVEDVENSVKLLNTGRLAVHLSPQPAVAFGLRGSEKLK